MKDIILVMSDQHSGLDVGYLDDNQIVQTPHLTELALSSQVFENAYSNCPLCVPSRMSFLSGKYAHETNILDNDGYLSDQDITLPALLSEKGYRTVLVGRMHFKGINQYHGFDERYVGDITTQWWNQKRNDLGAFDGTFKVSGCLKAIGIGNSPVQEFDNAVLEKSLDILKEESDKPLFLVVGFYGPHFPYTVKDEYFYHYYEKDLRVDNFNEPSANVYVDLKKEKINRNDLEIARSAYYGLVERLDEMIGNLYAEAKTRSEEAIFVYTSDHGDQVGKRGLFGKKTLYEESIRVPLLINDSSKSAQRYTNEVSLIDLSKTILDYANVDNAVWNGENIFSKDSPVYSGSMITYKNEPRYIQSVIHKRLKLVNDGENNILYNLDVDEVLDCSQNHVEVVEKLSKHLVDSKRIIKNYKVAQENYRHLKQWVKKTNPTDTIRFKFSKDSIGEPSQPT